MGKPASLIDNIPTQNQKSRLKTTITSESKA